MSMVKVHPRRFSDQMSEFHGDIFGGRVHGGPWQRAWEIAKILAFSTPCGLGFFVPALAKQYEGCRKAIAAEVDREAYPHIFFFFAILILAIAPSLVYRRDAATNLAALATYAAIAMGIMAFRSVSTLLPRLRFRTLPRSHPPFANELRSAGTFGRTYCRQC